MSRGFVSKANKDRAAQLEQLRGGYLSAIAWREAEWLARRHIEQARKRDAVARCFPVDRARLEADDAIAHKSEETAAWLALVRWPGAIASSGPRPWERKKPPDPEAWRLNGDARVQLTRPYGLTPALSSAAVQSAKRFASSGPPC